MSSETLGFVKCDSSYVGSFHKEEEKNMLVMVCPRVDLNDLVMAGL